MSRFHRAPSRFGTDMRARKRDEAISSAVGECITRPMTEEERKRLDLIPKPRLKERIIGMSITTDRAMKRKSYLG
ncbi:hypothetical protein AC624_16195 [Bacillus sp. FJAT-27238]|nr:hypothetical protein AC624_16195 [Bacillus sp. FJAT-27238]